MYCMNTLRLSLNKIKIILNITAICMEKKKA